VFIVIGAFRQRIEPRHLWLLVPFLALGMTSVRAVPPAWLGIVPLVAMALGGIEIGTRRGFPTRLAVVFALVVGVLPFLLAEGVRISEERFPVDARGHLADSPTFHDDRVGGYLIWAEGPERQVYLDDRAELYGWRMKEFVEVRSGETDWHEVFERDGVEQALLASSEPLIEDLQAAGWGTVHEDEYFIVLRP
jgi:hypothetical protein